MFTLSVDKSVVAVDGKAILTESELLDYYTDNYKTVVVNQYVTRYLLKTEASANNINEPTTEELEQLTLNFPSFAGYSADIEKNRDVLEEAYYIYELYKLSEIDNNTLENFLEERYGDKNTKMYEIYIFEADDHSLATEVETRLEEGESITNIEEQLSVQFFTSYTTSIESIVSDEYTSPTEVSEHDMNNMDMNDGVSTETENISTDTYSVGDVFHIMDDSGMEIIQIGKIMTLNSDREHFINLYFAQKYTSIKTSIINDLKGKYIVSYY